MQIQPVMGGAMLKDILERLEGRPPRVPLPAEVRKYLEEHKVPLEIIEDLAESSYNHWMPVGPVDVIPMPRMIEETGGIADCAKHGLMPVAGCRNFDPVVVDVVTLRICYVSHDILWDEDWSDISECVLPSPYLYEEFWHQAFAAPAFPVDYWDALEKWKSR